MEVEPGPSAPNEQGDWKQYETVFTNAKAGMDTVDKERVKRVVYEMSKVGASPAVMWNGSRAKNSLHLRAPAVSG